MLWDSVVQDRDLSAVTDDLWKVFYERAFGADSASLVVKRMKQKNVSFKWSKLYEVSDLLFRLRRCLIYPTLYSCCRLL